VKCLRLIWLSVFDVAPAIGDGMIISEKMVEPCAAQVTGG